MLKTNGAHEVHHWSIVFNQSLVKGLSRGDASRKANRVVLNKRARLHKVHLLADKIKRKWGIEG